MKKKLPWRLTLVFLFMTSSVLGQGLYWVKTDHKQNNSVAQKRGTNTTEVYRLNETKFRKTLQSLAHRKPRGSSRTAVMTFPIAGAGLQKFRVSNSPIMPALLAKEYPRIKTYKAIGIDDPSATMRFSLTPFGIHAMSLSGKRKVVLIDPVLGKQNTYKAHAGNTEKTQRNFTCLLEPAASLGAFRSIQSPEQVPLSDGVLRTYKLALSCTAEYGNYFVTDTTTAVRDILAQMVIAMNRVNEIYERDLGIRLVFVEKNDELIFYGDPKSDPWNGEWNATTQKLIDSIIGSANYDIGHNFNRTGGGNAGYIASVCVGGMKGSAYTGSHDPVGDLFFVDYVAHEMGHQFGAYHTMNYCRRSGSGRSEVEPGSGTSIMSYAGVCAPVNIQAQCNPYFNFVSIRAISENVRLGNSNCATQTPIQNHAPVANAGENYTIPISTAFVLKGKASDPDGKDQLTYQWTQNDPETASESGPPQSYWSKGPLYRSFEPQESPVRYFPKKEAVLKGNLSPTWEATPSVERTLNFAFTVRDNGSGFPKGIGQIDADFSCVEVTKKAGPFVLTSQNTTEIWYVGEAKEITWAVANTNEAPVETRQVTILLSANGGKTFDWVLAEKVPNDGQQTVSVPLNLPETTRARLKIKAVGNIFYAVNAVELTVERANFAMKNIPEKLEVCQPNTVYFTFMYQNFRGFSEPVTFSEEGLPEGVIVHFSPEKVVAGGTQVQVEITNTTKLTEGLHVFKITASSSGDKDQQKINLYIYNKNISAVSLNKPSLGQKNVSARPVFNWDKNNNAVKYEIEIAKDKAFTAVVLKETTNDHSYQPLYNLQPMKIYFWRVRALNNCGKGPYSEVLSFKTNKCMHCSSSGNGFYTTGINLVRLHTIDNSTGKIEGYRDYRDISTTLEKGKSYQLNVKVNTAGAYTTVTKVWIDWNANCSFNDPGEAYNLGKAENTVKGFPSNSPLTIVVPPEAATGETIMRVSTQYMGNQSTALTPCKYGFDGEVEDYTLKIGVLGVEKPAAPKTQMAKVWPNPSTGAVFVQFDNLSKQKIRVSVFDLRGRRVYRKIQLNKSDGRVSINLGNLPSGLYFLKLVSGRKRQITKLVLH